MCPTSAATLTTCTRLSSASQPDKMQSAGTTHSRGFLARHELLLQRSTALIRRSRIFHKPITVCDVPSELCTSALGLYGYNAMSTYTRRNRRKWKKSDQRHNPKFVITILIVIFCGLTTSIFSGFPSIISYELRAQRNLVGYVEQNFHRSRRKANAILKLP